MVVFNTIDKPDVITDEFLELYLNTPQHALMIIRYKDPDTIRLPVDGWLFYEYKPTIRKRILPHNQFLDGVEHELWQLKTPPDIKRIDSIDFTIGL
jgi:hypothetical protein